MAPQRYALSYVVDIGELCVGPFRDRGYAEQWARDYCASTDRATACEVRGLLHPATVTGREDPDLL